MLCDVCLGIKLQCLLFRGATPAFLLIEMEQGLGGTLFITFFLSEDEKSPHPIQKANNRHHGLV